jgi:CDP-diglyceride synthetase
MLGPIFWVTFVLSLIACIIIMIVSYAISRKFYSLLYVLSIFTYVNFVAFTIDAFDLNRNWVISLLTLSAILMIGVGAYFSKLRKNSSSK